jgi:heptosyltransferase-2
LRETYPTAGIDLLTTPSAAGVAPRNLVDEVLTVPRTLLASPADFRGLARLLIRLRHARYDAIAFLHHLTLASGVLKYRLLAAATAAPVVAGLDNGNGVWLTHRVPDGGFGAVHEVVYGLRVAAALGARSPDLGLAAQCSDADWEHAAHLLASLSPGPRVAIHPGSGGYSLARRWDPANWATVADSLVAGAGAQVILVGTPADGADEVLKAMRHPAVDLSGRTSLPQLAALLGQCDLFLGADSGVMHLATAMGVPVVALFGPSNHLAWGPWTPIGRSAVVRLGLRCSPCSYVGHRVGQRDGCWHRSCMADMQPQQVLAAVEALGVLNAQPNDLQAPVQGVQ